MRNLEAFHARKALLCRLYDRVAGSELLPITLNGTTIDGSSIGESKTRLEEERFIVSVCGQIKVGKSTFLNDFIFGEEVLPSADTPETAKLTEIIHGESFRYEAILYTQEEYLALRNTEVVGENGTRTTYYEAYLKPEIERYIQRTGELIFEDKVLAQGIFEGATTEELRHYISKDGKYTPFVKCIRIYHDAPILREATFIDTPGTNDPNPFRSQVTEQWIKNSDAVIFLMYAGAAFSRQDEDFINQFLLPIPSDRILVVLSKIDTVEDPTRPKRYVESALGSVPGFAQTIKHREVYPIAPIFSLYPKLLERHESGARVLPPKRVNDIEFQLYERPGDFSDLIEKRGLVPAFKEAVETHLVGGKGEGILASHAQKIHAIYEYARLRIQQDRVSAEQELALYGMNESELLAREHALKDARALVSRLSDAALEQQRSVSGQFDDGLREALFQVGRALIADGTSRITSATSLEALEKNLAWDLKFAFELLLREKFQPAINALYKDAKASIGDHLSDVRRHAVALDLMDGAYLNLLFGQFFIADILEEVSAAINERFTTEFLYSERVSKFLLWTNKDETRSRFEALLKQFFEPNGDFAREVGRRTREKFSASLSRAFNGLFDQLQDQLLSNTKILDALRANLDNLEASRNAVLEKLDALKDDERCVAAELADIEALLARGAESGEPAAV